MNWDTIEGNWKQFTGQIKEHWGELTENDIQEAEGNRDQLIGKIQAKYGYEYEKARDEVNDWLAKHRQ